MSGSRSKAERPSTGPPRLISHAVVGQIAHPIRPARTFNFQAGDVGAVPLAMGHYVENIGDSKLRFLEIFRSDHFADMSLTLWLALTPRELVRAHGPIAVRRVDHLVVTGSICGCLCTSPPFRRRARRA
jgi:oxalate decarboxylase/phosphoglucose isomerase-like protein (cupin superfamily)